MWRTEKQRNRTLQLWSKTYLPKRKFQFQMKQKMALLSTYESSSFCSLTWIYTFCKLWQLPQNKHNYHINTNLLAKYHNVSPHWTRIFTILYECLYHGHINLHQRCIRRLLSKTRKQVTLEIQNSHTFPDSKTKFVYYLTMIWMMQKLNSDDL